MTDENPQWVGHEVKSMLEEAFEAAEGDTVTMTSNLGFSNLLMEEVIRKLSYEIVEDNPAKSGYGRDYIIGRT